MVLKAYLSQHPLLMLAAHAHPRLHTSTHTRYYAPIQPSPQQALLLQEPVPQS